MFLQDRRIRLLEGLNRSVKKGHPARMRLSHVFPVRSMVFDEDELAEVEGSCLYLHPERGGDTGSA